MSDFLTNARDIPDYSWAAWTGIIGKNTSLKSENFNPSGFVPYKEAIETLWRYAKFRQFEGLNALPYTPNSSLDKNFQLDPACRWALSRGITTGWQMSYSRNGYIRQPYPIELRDPVNRAEWAYMLSQFCQIYAW